MRIVLDTNVLISALMFGGNPREILHKAIRGEFRLCLSEEILSELSEVLQRPRFGFSVTMVNQVISELGVISDLVVPLHVVSEIKDDPADDRILECAIEAGADYLVSGGKHLLELGEYSSVRIINPKQLLALL